MLDINSIQALTFDCYGTLIDWEQGILSTLCPLLQDRGVSLSNDAILETYAHLESEAEKGNFRPYKEVLQAVLRGFENQYGFVLAATEQNLFRDHFEAWRPFPDTVNALKRLAKHFPLNIISNIDEDLFAISAKHLEVSFAHIITAQSVGSYKPNPNNFHQALARIRLPKERVLHVAQSLYHDIAPANHLGIKSVWINRRMDKAGTGATPQVAAQPDAIFPDLHTLADYIEGQKRTA